jgi:hypothetical protein
MFKSRSCDRGFQLVTAIAAAVTVPLVMLAPATAQVSDVNQPYLDSAPAPRASKPRRNDAYQPTETGAGLGVLTSRSSDGAPAGGAGPSGVGGAPIYAQAPADSYTPRYGEPTRPYESYDRAPLQPVPAPNSYPPRTDSYRPDGAYPPPAPYAEPRGGYRDAPIASNQGYGQPYGAPPDYSREPRADDRGGDYDRGPRDDRGRDDGTYSSKDIMSAGHGFFGSISQGLGSVIENAFKRQGRPNGYILGEEGGGAFVAGLRYGEGTLYTRDAGTRRVYWQGPSLGYDFGGAGSKVMMLVYNLHAPNEIYERFGGVDGSAYLVGGLGMTLLTRDHVTIAPIRTGVGLRLGANVGYLKFTHKPTWNPF